MGTRVKLSFVRETVRNEVSDRHGSQPQHRSSHSHHSSRQSGPGANDQYGAQPHQGPRQSDHGCFNTSQQQRQQPYYDQRPSGPRQIEQYGSPSYYDSPQSQAGRLDRYEAPPYHDSRMNPSGFDPGPATRHASQREGLQENRYERDKEELSKLKKRMKKLEPRVKKTRIMEHVVKHW